MYLYGASGHAKVVIEILRQNDIAIDRVFDDNNGIKSLLDVKVSAFLLENIDLSIPFILSIGDNKIREFIANKYPMFNYQPVVHPASIIDSTSKILEGTVIMPGVIINSSVKIGMHCIINTSSSIDHDCYINDFVHISPSATLCGNVTIGKGSHIGAGSVVIQGITIGENVIIGAGSVIVNDIPDNVTVVGNPGRIIKK